MIRKDGVLSMSSFFSQKERGHGMKIRRWIGLGSALALVLVSLAGCGVADFAKDEISKKMESVVVGTAKDVESISTDRYAYQQLSDEEKKVYDQQLDCILNHQEKVPVSTKDANVIQKAYDCIMADYGGLFWVSGYQYNTYSNMDRVVGIEFAPQYLYDEAQTKEYQAQVDAVVEQWLACIGPEDSDYAKSKYVFEILIQNVEYVKESENNQNILSVFIGKQTVCQGYAGATQYLLQQLGIQSTIIHGQANGEVHAWNLVSLDGEYYLTDTTWGNSRYLMQDNSVQKQIDYQYLNTTSEFLNQTHVAQMNIPLPECTATADAYH